MFLKSTASSLALAAVAAFALTSATHAQTMIGSQQIGADDLAAVTEHCQMLSAEAEGGAEAATETTASSDTATGEERAPGESDAGGDMYAEAVDSETEAVNSSPDDTATASTSGEASASAEIDIGAITVEECEAAGLGAE